MMMQNILLPKKGEELEVVKDCFCEHYLHEKLNYPREGLVEKKLIKGDKVEFVEAWQNFYGYYYRVKKNGISMDITPNNLKRL